MGGIKMKFNNCLCLQQEKWEALLIKKIKKFHGILGLVLVQVSQSNNILHPQVQVPHLGLMKIWPRLIIGKTLGFQTTSIQVLAHLLQDPGTNTVSVRGCNIFNNSYLVKLCLFLHLLHCQITFSVVFRYVQLL